MARPAGVMRNGRTMRQRIFRPQLNHQAIWIDELRGDDIDRSFEIEDDASSAVIDFGDANLLETMVADQDGFGAVMRRSRRAEAVEIVIKARRVFDLIGRNLIRTLCLNRNPGDVAEGPEANGFDVRIHSGRLGLCKAAGES